MKQLSLISTETKLFHGGELAKGKRKALRPLHSKRPLHCVLKTKRSILFRNRSWSEREARRVVKKFGLRAYGLAVNHDHIHFVLKIPSRRAYNAFVRALCGILALKFGKGLWALAPFTRIGAWGKDFRELLEYLRKNREEAAGTRAYEPRTDWYAREKKKLRGT